MDQQLKGKEATYFWSSYLSYIFFQYLLLWTAEKNKEKNTHRKAAFVCHSLNVPSYIAILTIILKHDKQENRYVWLNDFC